MKAEYIMIGEIVKPQGVRGEVKVRPITCDPWRFEDLEDAYFKKGDKYVPVKLQVNRISPDGEGVYLIVNEMTDRNEAEKLRGEFLYVDREHIIELTEDENLIIDLVGLEGRDEEGNYIGKLVDVMQPGGNDVYVFTGGPRGEVLVPALRSVVKEVDVDGGTITLIAARMAEVAVYSDED